MTTLHMETDAVRTSVQHMKQTVEQMTELIRSTVSSAQGMNWIGPSRDEFVSEVQRITHSIAVHLDSGSILVNRAEREVGEWENTASILAGSYSGLLNVIKGITLPASISAMAFSASSFGTMGSGAVLGATASVNEISPAGGGTLSPSEYTARYQAMSWRDKFAEQKNLDAEIARISGTLPQDAEGELKKLDAEISNIDKKIADIQAQRDIADKKSQGLFNQVVPDWPLERDKQDGLPWRVKADDYEDQMADYDRQLAALQRQRDELVSAQNSFRTNLDQLVQLKNREVALDGVVKMGVEYDGPSAKYSYFPGTEASNCTKYAASRRDVPCSGNAYQWNEQAAAGGYEVGNIPAKGSVIVFEPDPKGSVSDPNYGHVAIVDQVKDLGSGKYEIQISEGGWAGGKTVNHRTIQVDSTSSGPNYEGVRISYIYDKSK